MNKNVYQCSKCGADCKYCGENWWKCSKCKKEFNDKNRRIK
jgi:DNA-directed RNA polymerase subunit RPC12/RpoP